MSGKEFNWDEFNKVLQGSSHICPGSLKDIENAIKAGKGETQPKPQAGQVWKHSSTTDTRPYRLITGDGGAVALNKIAATYTDDDVEAYQACGMWQFVADSLSDFIGQGGKL